MVGGKGPMINGRLLNREKSQLRAISEHTHSSLCSLFA